MCERFCGVRHPYLYIYDSGLSQVFHFEPTAKLRFRPTQHSFFTACNQEVIYVQCNDENMPPSPKPPSNHPASPAPPFMPYLDAVVGAVALHAEHLHEAVVNLCIPLTRCLLQAVDTR